MTKNGFYCASLFALLGLLSFLCAAVADKSPGWFGIWLIIVSVLSMGGCAFAGFAAVCDYLAENEE